MCILYWQGHANCNFISARNLIKFLSPSVKNQGFGPFCFDICVLCLSMCFFSGTFSSKGFFVQLSTSSLKQVFLLDPPQLPLLRICPNSSHITSVLTIVTAAISCQRELHGSLQCHVHIHACQLYCDLCQLVWLKIQSLQGKTASACHRMSSA